MQRQEAPGELEQVRAFVNTFDVETGTDALWSPAALAEWLREHGLMRGRTATQADLAAARALREALRSLLLVNAGLSTRKEAARTLNRVAARARLEVAFDASGGVQLRPRRGGVEGALGRLLTIAADAMKDGTWTRLKVCRADDCRWAFYDHARNRSRQWCSMSVCGNRTKARTYRRRHAV